MATIVSTVDNFTMQSNYTCTFGWVALYSSNSPSGGQILSTNVVTSYATTDTKAITFNYQNIGSEKVNMAILQLTSINNTYGGSFKINDTKVYPSSGKYTIYLQPSDIGATSTTFNLSFATNTVAHSHMNDYDSLQSEVINGSAQHSTIKYTAKKTHTGTLQLGEITLKIYTGEDFVNVPSTAGFFVGVNNVAKKVSDLYVGVSNKARKVTDGWVGINGVARKFWPVVELKDTVSGDIIKIDEAGDGNLVDYIVVAQDHYLNDINTERHTVLMRKNILNTTTKFGDNTWGESYVGEALDTYVNEAWKASLDGRIILKLMNITIPCSQWNSPYSSSANRQIWVPSRDEIDSSYGKREGPTFAYFQTHNTSADRIAKTAAGTAQTWWLRSSLDGMGEDGAYIWVINASGNVNSSGQHGTFHIRPVFCLSNSLPVSPISEGVYDLII